MLRIKDNRMSFENSELNAKEAGWPKEDLQKTKTAVTKLKTHRTW